MAAIGKHNTLTITKIVDFGVYLDGGNEEDILLPARYVPEGCEVGAAIEVFVYLDSEDLPIATTETPKAMVGECVSLKVIEVNEVGAFLDWGLPKDLLVPFSEQSKPLEVGRSYVVYLYIDKASERIVASTKVDKFLAETSIYFTAGQAVDLLIYGRTDLGYKAVINNAVIGLVFHNEVFKPLRVGEATKGFIKQVRADGKLDLCLQLANKQGLDSLAEQVLAYIQEQGGSTTLTDRSSPADIAAQFGVSKKSYKKALGGLYKQRKIVITPDRISLADQDGD